MIRIAAYLAVLCILLAGGAAIAAPGVQCLLDVYQLDTTTNNNVLLFTDTSWFVQGVPTSGFLVAFSSEIQFTKVDSANCSFQVHTVTLGPNAHNYARRFEAEYGLPARMDSIVAKTGTFYSLVITPLSAQDIDTASCSLLHTREGDFSFDPSAYIDIYFAPNSFGDFYWDVVKSILDDRYRLFKAINNFTLPGKYSIYLCPCPIYSVIWDKRFGMMVDPTRSAAFAIYNKEINTADPFLVLHASVYRNYGYAPAFISEGLASYLSYAAFEMRKIIQDGRNMPLDSLLQTYVYYESDPAVADRTSATFVKYLIDQYEFDKLLQVYRESNDLNLKQTIEDVYGKPIGELEQEWLHYVDTVTIPYKQLADYVNLAEAMFDFPMMVQYGQGLLERAATHADTVTALGDLVRGCFSSGDYYAATDYQNRLVAATDSTARGLMALGSYQMMNGLYDDALNTLEAAQAKDSADQYIQFNQAMNAMYRGDTVVARQLLNTIALNYEQEGPAGEARIALGFLLLKSGTTEDKAKATQYFREAISYFSPALQSKAGAPTAQMWMGMAYLGLNDTGTSQDFLQAALFVEMRPFYVGMINLWLGKVSDIRGEHDVAKDYYGRVIAGASAAYNQQEAQKYLRKPYHQ